jgi:hypothetical protein
VTPPGRPAKRLRYRCGGYRPTGLLEYQFDAACHLPAFGPDQRPTSSPRAWAYARHPRAHRALKSRRRHIPVPHWPRSKSQNGWSTRAVSQSRMPGQPAAVGKQLALVNVAVDQHRRELGGAGQQLRPRRGSPRPAQAIRGLSGRPGARCPVQSPAQPAMMSGVVVMRRARPGQRRRLELMPAGDDLAQLPDEGPRLGRHLAAQPGDGRERERVDARILPAAQQARHDVQLRPGQRPIGGKFPLEPLHAGGRPRETGTPGRSRAGPACSTRSRSAPAGPDPPR